MIFYDRVGIVCKERSGGVVVERFNGSVPAIVVPLPANVIADAAGSRVNVPRFQVILKPFAYVIPPFATSMATSRDGDNQILFSWGPYASLSLDGRVERHLRRGRLHHYEAVVRT